MNSKTEKRLIRIIREEYKKRLVNVLAESVVSETEVIDKRGNMLLSPGLKVRHKESGYEYTVDHIKGKGDSLEIHLRSPETPRFNPPDSKSELMELDFSNIDVGRASGMEPSGVMMQKPEKPLPKSRTSSETPSEAETLVITKKEFEDQYEVD